nr:solute carrier family 35 member G1-like [Ciona intestinalis]|eukprot:XP_002130426.1 solute carrier family 35 member G1-like [Ciona intestinalis]
MKKMDASKRKRLYGLSLAVLGGFCMSLGSVSYKLTKDTVAVQAFFLQLVIMYFVSLPMLTVSWVRDEMPTSSLSTFCYMLLYGAGCTGSSLFFYLALDHLSAGDAVAISNCYFAPTLLFAWLFLKEKVHPLQLIFVAASIVGVFLVARPEFLFGYSDQTTSERSTNTNKVLGIIFCVLSNVFTAGRLIIGRKLLGRASLLQLVTALSVIGMVSFVLYAQIRNEGWYIPCKSDWLYLIINALCICCTLSMTTLALQFERAGPVSMAYSLLIVFTFILESILLKSAPKITSIVGALLVFLSCVGTVLVQMKYT